MGIPGKRLCAGFRYIANRGIFHRDIGACGITSRYLTTLTQDSSLPHLSSIFINVCIGITRS
jgi:hypothetical protein